MDSIMNYSVAGGGYQKDFCNWIGQEKPYVCLQGRWMGGWVNKGPKYANVLGI